MPPSPAPSLPYRLACLCDLRDDQGRILLLHRSRPPNRGLYSPIGGKLHMDEGESPAQCARREIMEEAGLDIPLDRLHLMALISERAYEDSGHWLLFYYLVLGPVSMPPKQINEGTLDWHRPDEIDDLPIPDSDRKIIWPLVNEHLKPGPDGRPGFFICHIECQGDELTWTIDQSIRR